MESESLISGQVQIDDSDDFDSCFVQQPAIDASATVGSGLAS